MLTVLGQNIMFGCVSLQDSVPQTKMTDKKYKDL